MKNVARRVWLALAFLAVSCAPALADGPFYVSPAGVGDCLTPGTPCSPIQKAVDLVPQGGIATIYLAPGEYPEQSANVYYYRFISFVGNNGGACEPWQTLILVGNSTTVFWAQDHAIMGVNCMTLNSNGSGSNGVLARQFAIVDLSYVWFGNFFGGMHVAASEMSKINYIEGIQALGHAIAHVSAGGMSTVHLGGTIYVAPGLSYSYFAIAGQKSLLDGSAASMNAPWGASGYSQCIDATSTLYPPAGGFPGNLGPAC